MVGPNVNLVALNFGQLMVLSLNLTCFAALLAAMLDWLVLRLESSALFRDTDRVVVSSVT